MDGVMRALAKKKTECKEDRFFAMKFARQKLFKHCGEVTPMTAMLIISAHIFDACWKLWSFRKWQMGIDINPEDQTSYTTQSQEAFLRYVEYEYSAKHRRMSVIIPDNIPGSKPFPSPKACGFGLSSYDPDGFSSNDEEYLTPEGMVETTPGRSDCAARSLTAVSLHCKSPLKTPTI